MCPENVLAVCSKSCVCVRFFHIFKVTIGRGRKQKDKEGGGQHREEESSRLRRVLEAGTGTWLGLGQRAI